MSKPSYIWDEIDNKVQEANIPVPVHYQSIRKSNYNAVTEDDNLYNDICSALSVASSLSVSPSRKTVVTSSSSVVTEEIERKILNLKTVRYSSCFALYCLM